MPSSRTCAPRPTPWAPFLKPSLTDTYATHEHVKPGVEPNPTLRLITQTADATPWWFGLGPRLGKLPHLTVHLQGHVTFFPLQCAISFSSIFILKNWAWKWRKIFNHLKFCYLPMLWIAQFCQLWRWGWQGSGRCGHQQHALEQ